MADEMKKVGIVFKADGSVNFQKTLKEVNQSINENRSAFKLAQSEWDKSTSAVDKLRTRQEYLANQTEAYGQKVKELTDILKQQEDAENRDEAAISRTREQLNNAQSSLNYYQQGLEEVNNELESGTAKFQDYAKKVEETGEKLENAGKSLTKNVTAPILAVGTAAGVAWKKLDEAYDNIAAGTGATGEALQELQDSFDNVYGNFKFESASTSSAIADINTRFGFAGDTLEECTVKFLKFAEVNNADVSNAIADVSRYMGNANISASEYGNVLDALTAASQASGITVTKLSENLTKYGASMRGLGFDTSESIALFAQWEKSGMNAEVAFSGMQKAVVNFSKSGKDAKKEFKNVLDQIKNAPDITHATSLAVETFGNKAGPSLAEAIKKGEFSVDDFLKTVQKSEGQLEASFDAMQDPIDNAEVATHSLQLAGAELADTAMKSLTPVIEDLTEDVKEFNEWFSKLDDDTKETIVKVALIVAAVGPILVITGKIIGLVSTIITILPTLKAGIAAVNAVLEANPVLAVIIVIEILIATIMYLYQNCEWFRDGVNKIGKEIAELFTEKIPEKIDNVINWITDNWQGLLLVLVNPFVGGFKLLYDNCDAFRDFIDGWIDKIKEKIDNLIDKFKQIGTDIEEAWQAVKDAIKLPHFDIKGSFSITPPKTPKISVDWYAKGGILNHPTIFGANGDTLMGGGEAGAEAVLPIKLLMEYMRNANAESNAQLIETLPAMIAEAVRQMPVEVVLYLGNKLLSEEMTDMVVKKMNKQNSNVQKFKGASG